MPDLSASVSTPAVPLRYRGVWQRTLLQTPELRDTTTTVYWLQTAYWHADVRMPAERPDFRDVSSLAQCSPAQRAWLMQQQGFAGTTAVTAGLKGEICTWYRMLDFQPPAAAPDAGTMCFEPGRLVETGLDGSYFEHWAPVSGAVGPSAVLRRLHQGAPATPDEWLLIAGELVMHVRSRARDWPAGTLPGSAFAALGAQADTALLDFEIAFGRRTAKGWCILHSTFPWNEGRQIAMTLDHRPGNTVRLCWEGCAAPWQVLEWTTAS